MTKYPVGKCQELENFMVRRRGNRKNTENAKFNQRYREANQTHRQNREAKVHGNTKRK